MDSYKHTCFCCTFSKYKTSKLKDLENQSEEGGSTVKIIHYAVRDITWIGALHHVEVGTCTSDTWSLD